MKAVLVKAGTVVGAFIMLLFASIAFGNISSLFGCYYGIGWPENSIYWLGIGFIEACLLIWAAISFAEDLDDRTEK